MFSMDRGVQLLEDVGAEPGKTLAEPEIGLANRVRGSRRQPRTTPERMEYQYSLHRP